MFGKIITIGDEPELIGRTLQLADFVIVTEGLGSTTDDLTNAAVFSALTCPATRCATTWKPWTA